MLQRAANFKMAFVPFTGPPQALSALLGDHIVAAIADYPLAAGQLQSKSLRALVTGSRTRIPALPEVPTAIEAGIKDYELELWYAPFVVAKTPKDVIARYQDWFSKAVQAPAVKSKLANQQINVKVTCGEEFAVEFRRLYQEYGRAIREANLKIE
jgi:tripartite-type tricarboxylate transporter receptor subunit TctC